MKRFYAVLIPACAFGFVVFFAGFGGGDDPMYPSGAPPGYTNSPGDGKNCSHCMGGTVEPIADWITSDIPASGYVPGTTYAIAVTVSGNGNKGFELSPQDLEGNLIGTLIAGTDNALIGSGKYVTHHLASEIDPTTWIFHWTAPTPGVGTVTFYACAVVGELKTKTTTMVAPQHGVGISELAPRKARIFPNPIQNRLSVSFNGATTGNITLEILSITGKQISSIYEGTSSTGDQTMTFPVDLEAGIYLLRIGRTDGNQVVKFIVE